MPTGIRERSKKIEIRGERWLRARRENDQTTNSTVVWFFEVEPYGIPEHADWTVLAAERLRSSLPAELFLQAYTGTGISINTRHEYFSCFYRFRFSPLHPESC